jgi:hypothetical protein
VNKLPPKALFSVLAHLVYARPLGHIQPRDPVPVLLSTGRSYGADAACVGHEPIRHPRARREGTAAHEVFVEIGMSIKAASPFRRTMVVSLANDLDFYIPTRRAFEEGNYEPTTCPLEPGCGELLVAAAVKLLHELKP